MATPRSMPRLQRAERPKMRALRVLLDVNVLIGGFNKNPEAKAEKESAQQLLASIVVQGRMRQSLSGQDYPVQLITSYPILETFEQKLIGKPFNLPSDRVRLLVETVQDAAVYGPVGDVAAGPTRHWRSHLPMSDVEDVSILETAVWSRADLLVTNNLKDFVSKDFISVDTTHGRRAVNYAPGGDTNVVIAHPIDVVQWMRAGRYLHAERLWPEILKDSNGRNEQADQDFGQLVSGIRRQHSLDRRQQRTDRKDSLPGDGKSSEEPRARPEVDAPSTGPKR